MTIRSSRALLVQLLSVVLGVFCANSEAWALTVNLRAVAMDLTLPGEPGPIKMWAFERTGGGATPASVPGPELVMTASDNTLTINLTNNLPEPTSILVLGLGNPTVNGAPSAAVRDGSGRIQSLVTETPPGQTRRYVWTTAASRLRNGTFLYQSASHMAVQIQMGLYGMLRRGTIAGTNRNVNVILSEIDPALHAAVTAVPPTYGTPAYPSTIDYNPKYFLINGLPYRPTTHELLPFTGGSNLVPGNVVGVRFINAGLQTRVPEILGYHFQVMAEDGNNLRYAKRQASLNLPAGKTMDTIVRLTAAGPGSTPPLNPAPITVILDRRLNKGIIGKLNAP